MFSNSKELIRKLDRAELALANAQKLNQQLIQSFAQCTTLMDIQVEGSNNVFTFQKNGEVFTIETFHMMQDNIAEWRKLTGMDEQ